MRRLGVRWKGTVRLDTLVTGVMCMYALLTYCSYLHSALLRLQSLSLLGFVGSAVLLFLLRGRVRVASCWLWYGCFTAFALLSVLYASSPSRVISTASGVITILILSFSMSQVLLSEKRIEMLQFCFVAGSFVLLMYMVMTGQLNTETEHGGRLGGNLTGNANVFAALFMFAACASVYFIWRAKKLWARFAFLLALALQMLALILSGGRKFLLVPIIVAYVMLLLHRDRKGRKHIIMYTLVGVVGLIAVYNLLMRVPFLYNNIGYRFESFLTYTVGVSGTTDASTLARAQMRARAFELWLDAPIFGHGLGMFAVIGGFGVYSHCNYLELLCNHGVVGFAIYYGYWVYLLVQLLKLKNRSTMRLFMIALLVSFLFFDYGAVAYDMPMQQFSIVMASMYLYIAKKQRGVRRWGR